MEFRLLKTFDDVLVWCDVSTGHTRPYITKKNCKKVFRTLHGLRHPSHRATKPLINSRFVWHGMNIDIAKWCRSCTGCQKVKVSRHNEPVFGRFEELTKKLDHIHVDLVGPLPYSDGFKYLLTCVDRLHVGQKPYHYSILEQKPLQMPFSVGGWLDSGPLPQSLRTEVPSSNQSNGMVERFYRQLKAAIMAHE